MEIIIFLLWGCIRDYMKRICKCLEKIEFLLNDEDDDDDDDNNDYVKMFII